MKHVKRIDFPERKNELELQSSFFPESLDSFLTGVNGESETHYEEFEERPDGSGTIRRVRKKTSASVYWIRAWVFVSIAGMLLNGGNGGDGKQPSPTHCVDQLIHVDQQKHYGIVKADGNVNIRPFPGTEGNAIGFLNDGDIAMYLWCCECDASGRYWYKIEYGSCVGWVTSKYADLIVF
ncbi:MAG: SH3 domain-containing protein [Clostridia bacterium]|nr:SH3 domain-containing protein [Clostridia bacterium]